MLPLIKRYLSIDDLWSVLGYVLIVSLTRLFNSAIQLPVASVLASGMLAVFWLASKDVRNRNAEWGPNARILLWAVVAAASALVFTRT